MPVALLAIAAAALVLGTAASWDVTFGPLLRGIAEQISRTPIGGRLRGALGLSALAGAILSFEKAMRRRIGEAVGAMGAPLAAVFLALRHAFVWPARQMVALADDVGDALWGLRQQVIPAMIAAKVGWIPKHLRALEHQAVNVVTRVTRVVVHDVPHVVKPTVIRVARAVANPALPRIGNLEREASDLLKRIRGLTRRLAPAAVAGLVVAQIARMGFGWVRCSKVGRLGKQVCGMDESLLESLIADTLLVVGAISIVEFAEALQAVEGEVIAGLRGFVKEI